MAMRNTVSHSELSVCVCPESVLTNRCVLFHLAVTTEDSTHKKKKALLSARPPVETQSDCTVQSLVSREVVPAGLSHGFGLLW
jgi:hypothetical protein